MCHRLFEDKPTQNDIIHTINSIQNEFNIPAPYGFAQMSFERLQYIANHPQYADFISQRNNSMRGQIQPYATHTAETVAFMARFILAELNMDLNANKPLHEIFPQQADIAGLQISEWPTLYRFDTRKPEEIISAKGFHGNNRKAKHSLIAHSLPESTGGTWTSLSRKEANHFVLRDNYIQSMYKSVDVVQSGSREHQILSQLTSPKDGATYMFYRTYEYQAKNQIGATPKFGISREEEVVAPDVPLSQIKGVREVIYFFRLDYQNNLKIPPKEWEDMRPENENLYLGPWIHLD